MSKKKNEDPRKKVEDPKPVEDKKSEFVTKTELTETLDKGFEAFFERMKGIESHIKSNTVSTDDMEMTTERTVGSRELGKDVGGIEKINEQDLVAKAELEMFMEQELLINVPESQEESDEWHAIPMVNGKTMPIQRGVDTLVKRKYVEVLARCRTTRYTQVVDKLNPEIFDMRPKAAQKFPFMLLHDPHPHGRQWLKKIMEEAA